MAIHIQMKGPEQTNPQRMAAGDTEIASATPRRRMPLAAILLIAALSGGLAFVGGFAAFATHVARLSTPVEQRNADAIIVLTGGQARIDAAVDLLRSGKGERLLISGVNPIARAIDLQRAADIDAGLLACCIDIDRAALDTIGNAEESAKWVTSHAYDSIIVVTNNYHMPRSLLELKRLIGGADLLPYPVVNTRLDDGSWIGNRDALRVLFTEYAKYLAALARGVLPLRPAEPEPAEVPTSTASAN